jgi:Tat protein translocase TatB subunit
LFGIAWTEMLVILAVALLVIGPADLPRVLYGAGKIFRNIRKFTGDIQQSLDSIMRDQELDEIVRDANRAGGDNLQFELDKQVEAEKKQRLSIEGTEKKPEKNDAPG